MNTIKTITQGMNHLKRIFNGTWRRIWRGLTARQIDEAYLNQVRQHQMEQIILWTGRF